MSGSFAEERREAFEDAAVITKKPHNSTKEPHKSTEEPHKCRALSQRWCEALRTQASLQKSFTNLRKSPVNVGLFCKVRREALENASMSHFITRCEVVMATHCNTLQHTATHCNTLQHTVFITRCEVDMRHGDTLQHTATHCNTLQHTATHCNTPYSLQDMKSIWDMVTHCNTLQHTATHCKTLQHTATHCNTPD